MLVHPRVMTFSGFGVKPASRIFAVYELWFSRSRPVNDDPMTKDPMNSLRKSVPGIVWEHLVELAQVSYNSTRFDSWRENHGRDLLDLIRRSFLPQLHLVGELGRPVIPGLIEHNLCGVMAFQPNLPLIVEDGDLSRSEDEFPLVVAPQAVLVDSQIPSTVVQTASIGKEGEEQEEGNAVLKGHFLPCALVTLFSFMLRVGTVHVNGRLERVSCFTISTYTKSVSHTLCVGGYE